MTELHLNLIITLIIYIFVFINYLNHEIRYNLSKKSIKQWFYSSVTLTNTKKITRTSELFNSYKKYTNITRTTKQDLILFGKLFKAFIREENIPLVYKKSTYAGYTNIRSYT